MNISTKKGPIFDSGQCRCCGATKRCRLLNVEYQWFGQKEVYSDMFVDCFGLLLSNLDADAEERLICATCVSRLREASCFRVQVLGCEEKLLRTKLSDENESNIEVNEEVKVEDFKQEVSLSLDEPDDALDNIDAESAHGDVDEIESKLIKRKTRKLKSDKKKRNKKAKIDVNLEHNRDEMTGLGGYEHQIQNICTSHENNCIKSTHNLLTIVENSYVCPFDTSFSDYFCVYCRQLFTDPNKLREHSLTHDPKTFKDINVTNKKSQIDIYRIDCRLCTEQIRDLEDLKQHLVNTHGKVLHKVVDDFLKFRLTSGSLICMECNSGFSFFHALKKHMAEHFGTCICDVCGAHYFEERMLVLHQKTHQRIDEYFECKECGKTFKSKYTRYIHVARMHKKEAAYQCNKCDEVFFSYTLRYRHMIDVHGEERMFQCEHCDRAYDSRKSLREHNRRFHLKILKHQCDLCDKRFYLPSRLKEHMASHTGERNFRCEYCGKSYPRLRGLKVHMQSHTNEKKFKCAMCNASFTQNVNLKNHIKRQHQNMEIDDNYNG